MILLKEFRAILVVAALGCDRTGPPATTAIEAPARSPGAATDVDACLDRVLGEAGLNRFGDAPDTMYAGGSPLFDEASGRSTPRLEYVKRKRPDLAARCE